MKDKKENVCGIKGCVEYDSRICFGIALFDDEAKADEYAAEVKAKGFTYNGGWYHGMPCGRDKSWDHEDKVTGVKLFAVTD
jgi:hypothetical protein